MRLYSHLRWVDNVKGAIAVCYTVHLPHMRPNNRLLTKRRTKRWKWMQLFLLWLPNSCNFSGTRAHFLLKIDHDHRSEFLFDLFLEFSIVILPVELLNVVVSILCIIHASSWYLIRDPQHLIDLSELYALGKEQFDFLSVQTVVIEHIAIGHGPPISCLAQLLPVG